MIQTQGEKSISKSTLDGAFKMNIKQTLLLPNIMNHNLLAESTKSSMIYLQRNNANPSSVYHRISLMSNNEINIYLIHTAKSQIPNLKVRIKRLKIYPQKKKN